MPPPRHKRSHSVKIPSQPLVRPYRCLSPAHSTATSPSTLSDSPTAPSLEPTSPSPQHPSAKSVCACWIEKMTLILLYLLFSSGSHHPHHVNPQTIACTFRLARRLVYDRALIGRALFSDKKGTLTANLKLWWEPPQYQPSSTMPTPDSYYYIRLLLWMPKKMWKVDFKCPNCPGHILRSRGLYKNVHLVMDLRDFFYITSEYLDCRECNSSFISWDDR